MTEERFISSERATMRLDGERRDGLLRQWLRRMVRRLIAPVVREIMSEDLGLLGQGYLPPGWPSSYKAVKPPGDLR